MQIFRTIVAASIAVTLLSFPLFVSYAQEEPGHRTTSSAPEERFFGQIPPGDKAVPFAPEVLIYEAHDSPVVPPDKTWLLYQGMGPDVLFYGMVEGRLTAIENPLSIEFPETCNGVAISPSGNRFYIEEWKDGSTYLYYIDRKGDRWTSPTYVDLGLKGNWWQISIASSGNLYFGSDKIMVSTLENNLHVRPIPLKLSDNSDMKGTSPFISPDESYIIYSIDGDLYISYRQNDGKWTMPVDLGPDINSDQLDLCPQITPDGKYLLLTTRRDFPDFAIYWAKAGFVEALRPKK